MARSIDVRPESAVLDALRAAARQVRHHPRFALVTMLVLGLGTGAAATVFAVVDAVVLRPLPYAAPDRLVTIWDTNAEKAAIHDPISPVNFMDVRALPVFEDAAAWWRPGINLVDPGLEPARVIDHRGQRQPVRAPRREAAGRRRLPRRRAAVRAARADRGDQRPAVAHALRRRPVGDRPAAAAERRALHRGRGDAARVPLSGRRGCVAAAALGHDAAQPRRSLHGSRRAHEAGRHGRRRPRPRPMR